MKYKKIFSLLILTLMCEVSSNVKITNKYLNRLYGSDIEEYDEENSNDYVECQSNDLLNSNLETYFKKLENNFGNNSEAKASCGYVALTMVLNYYDTFLNGNIVDSIYEKKAEYSSVKLSLLDIESPGTLYEPDYKTLYGKELDENNTSSYLNYLRRFTEYGDYPEKSLHSYLVLLGTNNLSKNNSSINNKTITEVVYTNEDTLKYTIDEYFKNRGFSYKIVQKQYSTTDSSYNLNANSVRDVIEFAVSEISEGRPVIMGSDKHARVAYAFEQSMGANNYALITHEGYLNQTAAKKSFLRTDVTDAEISRDAKGYISATSIVFDDSVEFNPGYNYHSTHFNDDNTHQEKYTNHNDHAYDYSYVNYSNNQHKSLCKCQKYKLELHDYRKSLLFNDPTCRCGAANPNYSEFKLKDDCEECVI